VVEHFRDVPPSIQTAIEVSTGPITDRLLADVADQHIDLLLVGDVPDGTGQRTLIRRLAMKARLLQRGRHDIRGI
jgi:hypothetical protein